MSRAATGMLASRVGSLLQLTSSSQPVSTLLHQFASMRGGRVATFSGTATQESVKAFDIKSVGWMNVLGVALITGFYGWQQWEQHKHDAVIADIYTQIQQQEGITKAPRK